MGSVGTHFASRLGWTAGLVTLATGCLVDRSPLDLGTDASIDAPFNDVFTPPRDAGTDAFTPVDIGPVDAFVDPDAFAPIDAFSLIDTGPPDAFVSPDAFVPPDAFVGCIEGATRCADARLERCSGGRFVGVTECSALGCGGVPAHCLLLVPSNVPASEMRGGPDIAVTTSTRINTTACSGLGSPEAFRRVASGGATYCVLSVNGLRVAAGAQIDIVGDVPLVILATSDVTIDGNLASFGVGRTQAGAGESSAGRGGDGAGTMANLGGGAGGSFCGAGGAGGVGGVGGTPRPAVAPSLLSPLRGGSPGGFGSGQSMPPDLRGGGGRGGGAIQISTRGTLTINGTIFATGGGGGPGLRTERFAAAGGGGGSGGAVLLEGTSVVFEPRGRIDLRGGGGGGGACFDGSNDPDENGRPGQDGYGGMGTRPSGGAPAPTCEGMGRFTGSTGGAGSGLDQPDGLPGGMGDNGGGGGGGAGCLAIRTPSAPATAPTYPTAGVLATGMPLVE